MLTDLKDKKFSFFADPLKKERICKHTLAHFPVAAFGGWTSPTTSKRANFQPAFS